MNERPEDIISDDDVLRVHGHANFGTMTPREVLADGVWKYSMGYSGGSTQLAILREHGLITKPRHISYNADLTKKGKAYLRSLNPPPPDAWNTRAPSPCQDIAAAEALSSEIPEGYGPDISDDPEWHKAYDAEILRARANGGDR